MKLRIWGTREECETVKRLVRPFMKKVQDNGRFYLNRGSTEIGRMYLDFELDYIIDDDVIDAEVSTVDSSEKLALTKQDILLLAKKEK